MLGKTCGSCVAEEQEKPREGVKTMQKDNHNRPADPGLVFEAVTMILIFMRLKEWRRLLPKNITRVCHPAIRAAFYF